MEGFPPSSIEEDVNMISDELDLHSLLSELELHLSPPEVPVNQSSISCNDQGGQNNVINDSIQQITPFPTSFPETMMEGFQPSFMEEVDNMTLDQLGFQSEEDTFNMSELLSPPPEVPVTQSSISCNDQGGKNNVINDSIQQTTPFPTSFPETMTGHGYMTPNGTTSQHGEFNQPGPSSPAPWYQPNPNLFYPQCANPLREQQWTDYQLPMSNQVPAMLPGPQLPMNQWHQYSNIHQPQPGHGYMTPNATTSEHGGFIQPGPSFPTPRSHYFSNQGQVDRAAVIPNIDNVQQENFVPRSRMDNLQVRGLKNQTATPNASNPGLGRGLNAQQVEMVRSKDPFWNYIEDRTDGSMKCKFCPHTFANKTSISRIKWHLSGEEGHNVAICRGVTKEVQEASFQAMCGGNKRQKITASSVNVNDCGISTCPQEQNIEINMVGGIGRVQRELQVVEPGVGEERISSHAIEGNDEVSMNGMRAQEDRVSKGALESRLRTEPVDRALEQSNLAGGAGRIQVGVQGMEQGPGEERIQSHLQAENGMENTGEGSFRHDAFATIPGTEQVQLLEPRGDSSQFCLDTGRCYDQHCAPSVNDDVTRHDALDMVRVRTEPVENNGRSVVLAGAVARSSESLKYNKTRGAPLPTSSRKPVGQAFKENTKVLWSLLMDGEVPTIGIYGMGGVGKTTVLKHIYNELLQRPDICDHAWWVTVSQDFSINTLQNLIAKCLYLDLSREDDDLHRAAKLLEKLRKKQKWILILDDLWNYFELHKVGIPENLEGCKLIMTTRSETVCYQMACQHKHKIKVKPLSNGEAWTLFMEKLGRDVALSLEVERIAKAVARECDGLPLGIITVARSLRGVDDLHEWRNTLNKLRESEFRDMDEKVFKLLRFSYDRLGDLALQQCLLYCALFPEDYWIERERLIGYLIDEGIIIVKRRRGDAFDEGHTILNRLENVCLLKSSKMEFGDNRHVKMHDLIRDMAIQILQDNAQVMVKARVQLKELPDAEEWTENLMIVSLMQNEIEEIPSSHSPMCPNLSSLFLYKNEELRLIADSFFKQLHGLKVLDLSYTGIKNLPDSVSDLVNLAALLLKNCDELRHVPSLEKLRALKRLDLSRTSLEKMPQGMECLPNLRYLRMNGCGEKEFPCGILSILSRLQVFILEEFMARGAAPITVGKELRSMRNLETLECHFEGFSDFVEYLKSRDGIQSLSTYKILVGEVDSYLEHFPCKSVGLGNLSINGDRDFQVKFLNGIQGLYCQCIDARSLCDVLSLENATELECIRIRNCNNMESLVSSSWFCSAPPPLPSYNGMFSGLKRFHCSGCKSMKKLFPLVVLPNLVNLERIEVHNCEKIEEIIGTTDEESSTSNSITEVILPKLRTLKLFRLPELKSICRAKLICSSLEVICVIDCDELKTMPISLPLIENGQSSPPPSLKNIRALPKEWWESVVER